VTVSRLCSESARTLGSVELEQDADEAASYLGTTIAGRYKIETLLAEGGMGLVFRARHLVLEQPIALKLVRPMFAHQPVPVARFLDEARAIARLKSPHVAHVFDSGTAEDGTPYMALELLNGWDLRSVLEREGPMSCERAAEYVIQACRAVAEAHSIGLVHRDLKPENLFLHRGTNGAPIVKVLDFGISKWLEHSQRSDGRSLTVEGETVGSLHYMAPEQMAARAVDARTDIWALGVVLFELVTGRVPFEGDSVGEVASALFSEGPPFPSEFRAEVPPAFDDIVARCLRRVSAERYWYVSELSEALQDFLDTGGSVRSLESERPTLISVSPTALQSRLPRLRAVASRSGWVYLSLMGLLVAGVKARDWPAREAASLRESAPLEAESSMRSRDDERFVPLQVDPSALMAKSAPPRVDPLPAANTKARRLPPPQPAARVKEQPKPMSPSAQSKRAALDELISPYGDVLELRAEANDK
jgi:serine/threonine protein kinase